MLFKKNKGKNQAKTKKPKARYVKVCPKCKSFNIKVSNQGGSAGVIFGAPTIYRCLDCGYSNYAFPEIDLNEFKRNSKENGKEKNRREED